MPALMSIAKSTGVSTGFRTQAAPVVLKRHALRCRPVAFKENDRIEDKASSKLEEIKHKITDNLPSLGSDHAEAKNAIGRQPAMDRDAPKVNPAVPAFTRRREVYASRFAMIGIFAACLWEANLPGHPGVIGQISQFTGISPTWVGIALLGTIAYNALGGLLPGSPTYASDNQRDVQKRPAGPTTSPGTNSIQEWFGIDGWGFTKKNEIFNGRLAMLGIFAACVQEWRLGGAGPLGQVAYYLNITPDEGFFSLATKSLIIFTFLALGISVLDGNLNGADDEKEMY